MKRDDLVPGRDNLRRILRIEVVRPMLVDHIPEGVEPGDHWVCDNGCRHFQCFICEDVFNTNKIIDHGKSEPGLDTSVCDGCNDKVELIAPPAHA